MRTDVHTRMSACIGWIAFKGCVFNFGTTAQDTIQRTQAMRKRNHIPTRQ
jgi:hypothetical protein